MTRRQLVTGLAAGAVRAQFKPGGESPKPRTAPLVCLYSRLLVKVEYDELGRLLRALGFDGCDLSVEPGGHVIPEQAPVDLMRAIEAMTGVGLEVPMITTGFTSLAEPAARTVLNIAGFMGVPLFRPGCWKYTNAEIEARLAEVQREIAGLAAAARAFSIAMAIPNAAGEMVGQSIWDMNAIVRGMDSKWVGYDFDAGAAAAEGGVGGWSIALRLVLPRLKAVTLKDFYWSKETGGAWKMTPCPLGEGMVDWSRFFAMLARAKFTGPLSLHREYQPKDELEAIRRDLEFVRKQMAAAYGTRS